MELTPTLPESIWCDRFAKHLGGISPALAPAEAFAIAGGTFADACDLLPEEAAEIYAMEAPPDEASDAKGGDYSQLAALWLAAETSLPRPPLPFGN